MTTEEICSELFNSIYWETLVYGAALAIRQIAWKTGRTVDDVIDDIISERIKKSMEESAVSKPLLEQD